MEDVKCLFCQKSNYQVLYDNMPDQLTGLPGRFRLVKCNYCQLIYQHPRPDAVELNQYYPENYESYNRATPATSTRLQQWLINYGLRKRALPLLNDKTTEKVLDVGCATGQFLHYLQLHSQLELYGVELNPGAAQFAREKFNLDVFVGNLKSVSFPDEFFDAVTMWDVLEHLPAPDESLREIRRVLRPNGLLLFKVPVIDGLNARLFGQYWAGLDLPRHLYVYSRQTIHKLLTETGFKVERVWSASGSFFPFLLSLQFLLKALFPASKTVNIILQWFRSFPVRLMTFPYFYITDRLQLGAQVSIIAKKG